MAARIRSLAVAGPLLVPLSSGSHLRLSPGEVSGELADVEVTGLKIDKLRERRLIEVESTSDGAGEDGAGKDGAGEDAGGAAAGGAAADAEPEAAARTTRRSSRSRQR